MEQARRDAIDRKARIDARVLALKRAQQRELMLRAALSVVEDALAGRFVGPDRMRWAREVMDQEGLQP